MNRNAVVVGGGHNGLTAACFLAREGWQVDVFERAPVVGGAATSGPALGEGTIVDFGAAAHPFGVASPAFRELGLVIPWRRSAYPMAHPLDDGEAAVLAPDLEATARGLGKDGAAWKAVHGHIVRGIDEHLENFLGPVLRLPPHPLRMAAFGITALPPANALSTALFRTPEARALLAGSAVHAITPPSAPLTSAFGLLFGALGMTRGWPVVEGGTGVISTQLEYLAMSLGVRIHTEVEVSDLRELPRADATILNLTPSQVRRLEGLEVPGATRRRLARWKSGAGVFKVDYLLDGPVPWNDDRVGHATTVHVGGTAEEIDAAEREAAAGKLPERPFVMVCQQSVADPSRGPVLWTYAHVPSGYVETRPGEVSGLIEAQIERFAPGFRDRIVWRRVSSPAQLGEWDPNLAGGDIAGGSMAGLGALLRPGFTARPYRLGPDLYLASGATPPGAGVHGMPGMWAAKAVLRDLEE
ncbi:phytoene desaturase family protein [Corynebacterium doosanense]|uniref:FAD-dependent oxidoreductase n=1 Tax=Corynebacterium doosanense CAU 212 = DSM 45436 TaxID=558173 RepID=A0A097IDR9_9CORY|nr:NAD(P)/FAD-dependent oxidoreductase [Corynebacterium doosanense]AIT60272.1 FAD-dependent oxidoreductase [Corynebacterium doosanense CAU 212 = DSM 45436]